MDEGTVRAYADTCGSILDSSPQMDEANTKAAVLRDFLDLLGWDIPQNTQLEYSVEAFGQTYRVDYALVLESAPVAFLEAKGADTALTNDHEQQLASYMTNEDVNYGILTNGKEYRFFQRRLDSDTVSVRTVGDAELADLPNRLTVLRAYTKSAVESGASKEILRRINELREARETLRNEKDDLAAEIADLLATRVSEEVSPLAEPQAKELIDRLVDDIEDEIDLDNGGSDDSGKYVIRIVDGDSVATFSGDNQASVMTETVDFLVTKHDLVSQLEPLPYIPGRTRAILNDSARYNGTEMKQPKELSNGCLMEANLSADQKQREIHRMAEECGLAVSFSGGW
jgi:hypothetical protein